MKRLVVGLFLFLFLPVQASWFGYDRGIAAARDGDDERAVKLLTDELTSHPENPALLYDSGVLAARQKNYEQAEAFFLKAVRFSASDNQLHQQALFNLGNTYVATHKLPEALAAYNQLLALDQHNERALKNLKVIKKVLEQDIQEQPDFQDGGGQAHEQSIFQQDDEKNNQGNSKQQQSSGSKGKQQKSQQGGEKHSTSTEQQQGQQQGGVGEQLYKQNKNGQFLVQQKNKDTDSAESQYQQDNQQDGSGDQKEKNSSQQKSGAEQQKKQSAEQSAQDKQSGEKDAANSDEQSAEQKATDQQSSNSPLPDGTSCNQNNQKRDGKDSNQFDERDSYKKRYGKRDSDANGKDKQQSGADKSKGVKSEPDDKEGGNDQRTQQHDDSPSRARRAHKNVTTSKTMKVGSKAQESAKKETKKQYAAWAESMLDAVQLNDEALNKVLVQRAVAGSMGGRDGECCW